MIETAGKNIFIVCGATDMRKGINGLAAAASAIANRDSFESSLFVFCNGSHNRIKIIEWDGDGFWLYQKRLERGTFPWPPADDVKKISVTSEDFKCLIAGTKLQRKLRMDEISSKMQV